MWDIVRDSARKYGEKAVVATQKAGQIAKLNAEIHVNDRNISKRQKSFGVELYNHVEPMVANNIQFWSSEDILIKIIRPNLLSAQREIAALNIRKIKIEEFITIENLKHDSSINTKTTSTAATATTSADEIANAFKENIINASKQVAHTSLISKYKTDLLVMDNLIKDHKQQFGKKMFPIFVSKEDNESWIPTERTIRSIYDKARKYIIGIEKSNKTKVEDLRALGATYSGSSNNENKISYNRNSSFNTEQQRKTNDGSATTNTNFKNHNHINSRNLFNKISTTTPQVSLTDSSSTSNTKLNGKRTYEPKADMIGWSDDSLFIRQ